MTVSLGRIIRFDLINWILTDVDSRIWLVISICTLTHTLGYVTEGCPWVLWRVISLLLNQKFRVSDGTLSVVSHLMLPNWERQFAVSYCEEMTPKPSIYVNSLSCQRNQTLLWKGHTNHHHLFGALKESQMSKKTPHRLCEIEGLVPVISIKNIVGVVLKVFQKPLEHNRTELYINQMICRK